MLVTSPRRSCIKLIETTGLGHFGYGTSLVVEAISEKLNLGQKAETGNVIMVTIFFRIHGNASML